MFTQRFRTARSMLLVSLLLPAAGAAQAPPGLPPLAGIASGKTIRAKTSPERTYVGAYTPVGDGRLGIRPEGGPTDTLRLSEIRELSVRGRHTKTGAIIGGVAGAAFGTFIAVIVNALCETDSCDGAEPFVIAIPAFGAGGALLGAAVGSAFPRWKRVYP